LLSTIKDTDPLKQDKGSKMDLNHLMSMESDINLSGFQKQVSFELGVSTERLDFDTKMRILEKIYESKFISIERKRKYRRALTFDDPNFKIESFVENTLDACLPDLDKKEKYWGYLKIKDNKQPSEKYQAIMRGFARSGQFELMKSYYCNYFFEEFAFVKNYNNTQYTALFYKFLNPSFAIYPDILKKLKWLDKNRISDNDYVLKKYSNKAVAELDVNIKVAQKHQENHLKLKNDLEKLEKGSTMNF